MGTPPASTATPAAELTPTQAPSAAVATPTPQRRSEVLPVTGMVMGIFVTLAAIVGLAGVLLTSGALARRKRARDDEFRL